MLTARVLRLLLAGVDPASILCLTFTKAGAAEMAERIHARLAHWVRLDTPRLRKELFALSDLDEKPRVLHQPGPVMDAALRKRAPGTVHVIFIVNVDGRVETPVVRQSSDPVFDAPALAAVRQWKFEPGKRNGEAVRFRMQVPITFPKGS